MKPNATNTSEIKAMLSEMKAGAQQFKAAAGGSVTDAVSAWLPAQYAFAARKQLAAAPEAEHFKILQAFVQNWALFRRGDHSAARLQLDREKLELDVQKYKDVLAAAQKEIQKLRDPKLPLSDADRRAILDKVDEIFGLK